VNEKKNQTNSYFPQTQTPQRLKKTEGVRRKMINKRTKRVRKFRFVKEKNGKTRSKKFVTIKKDARHIYLILHVYTK
jgi:hypothetical protein